AKNKGKTKKSKKHKKAAKEKGLVKTDQKLPLLSLASTLNAPLEKPPSVEALPGPEPSSVPSSEIKENQSLDAAEQDGEAKTAGAAAGAEPEVNEEGAWLRPVSKRPSVARRHTVVPGTSWSHGSWSQSALRQWSLFWQELKEELRDAAHVGDSSGGGHGGFR